MSIFLLANAGVVNHNDETSYSPALAYEAAGEEDGADVGDSPKIF